MPESTSWWWRLEAADGTEMDDPGGRQEFPTRGDAESYVGEYWAELADRGVTAVSLYEGDQKRYGPMSLDAG